MLRTPKPKKTGLSPATPSSSQGPIHSGYSPISNAITSPGQSPIYGVRRHSFANSPNVSIRVDISEEDKNIINNLNTSLSKITDLNTSILDTSIPFLTDVILDLDATIENLNIREDYLEHNTLTKIMLALGYQIDDEGVCYGFNTLAGLAIQIGDFDKFQQRTDLINKSTPSSIVKVLKKIKKNLADSEQLSPEDYEYLDLLIFFQNITIAQSPSSIKDILPSLTNLNQGSTASLQLVESEVLSRRGGRHTVFQYANTFDRDDLVKFFLAYQNLCTSDLKITQPITLNLSAVGHAIGVTFLPKTAEWIFIDANYFKDPKTAPGKTLTIRTKNINDIANAVYNGYMGLVSEEAKKKSKLLAMAVEGYTTGDNKIALVLAQTKFSERPEIKEFHKKENSKRIGVDGETILHAAARKPGYKVDLKLHQHLINQRNAKGDTPLMCACRAGNIEMVKSLLAPGDKIKPADPNIPSADNRTPLQNATLFSNFELIKLLVENGAKDIPDHKGRHLIHEICLSGNVALLDFVLKNCGINLENNIAYDPAEYESESVLLKDEDEDEDESLSTSSEETEGLLSCPIPIYAIMLGQVAFAEHLFKVQGVPPEASVNWALEHRDEFIFDCLVDMVPTLKSDIPDLIKKAIEADNFAQCIFLLTYFKIDDITSVKDSPFFIANSVGNRELAFEMINLGHFTYHDFLQAAAQGDTQILQAMLKNEDQLEFSRQSMHNMSPQKRAEMHMDPDYHDIEDLDMWPVHVARKANDKKLIKLLSPFFGIDIDITPSKSVHQYSFFNSPTQSPTPLTSTLKRNSEVEFPITLDESNITTRKPKKQKKQKKEKKKDKMEISDSSPTTTRSNEASPIADQLYFVIGQEPKTTPDLKNVNVHRGGKKKRRF